jgi:hypothetical protein
LPKDFVVDHHQWSAVFPCQGLKFFCGHVCPIEIAARL